VIQPLIAILLLANAGMLYTYLDRMFLSAVALPEDVSYYTIAQTLVFSISGVISGAVSVSVPRLGYYLGINDYKAYDDLVNKGGRIFMFCIIPLSFGLAVLGPHATILYAGERYLDAGTSVILFALRSIPWALALILENQIIFVQGYENRLTVIYFIGGGINLALNSLLAFNHYTNPAYYIVTTIIAELVVIALDMLLIRQNNLFRMRKLLIHTGKYMLYASGFFVIAYLISVIHPIEWIVNGALLVNILATIVSCVIYYIVVLALVKDEIFISSLEAIKNKVFKKKG
jgi:polysaccharide biosynthesis protein